MPRPKVQFGSLQRTGKHVEKWRGHYFEYVDGKRPQTAMFPGGRDAYSE